MPPDLQDIAGEHESVVGVTWETFQAWFASVWEQGQHVAMIGRTGCGKTTASICVLRQRRWVLALDAKGGDETLAAAGFTRITDWPPPRKVQKAIAEGKPARLVAGFSPERLADRPKLTAYLARVLDNAWMDGGWSLSIDELQLMADRKMMGLGGQVEQFLIAARNKRVSVVNLFQAPAWVPTAATRQASWIFLYPTMDQDVIKSVARKIGRPWKEVEAILHELPDFHFVVAGLNPRNPLVLTKAPKVA